LNMCICPEDFNSVAVGDANYFTGESMGRDGDEEEEKDKGEEKNTFGG